MNDNKFDKKNFTISDKIVDYISKVFIALSNHPDYTPQTSIVLTLNENNKYYPIQAGYTSVRLEMHLVWLLILFILWTLIIIFDYIFYFKNKKWPLFVGLFVSQFLALLNLRLSKSISLLNIFVNPSQVFLSNVPQIKDIGNDIKLKNLNNYVSFINKGDYKILFNSNNSENMDDENIYQYGYIYPADTFIKKTHNQDIVSMDLQKYLKGDNLSQARSNSESANKISITRFNAGRQNDNIFPHDLMEPFTQCAYFMCIVLATWAIYITSGPFGNSLSLKWIILAFLLSIATVGMNNLPMKLGELSQVLFMQKMMLIMAISFSITSILMVN